MAWTASFRSCLPRDGRAVRPGLLSLLALSVVACGDGATGPGSTAIGAEGGTASLAEGAVTLSVPAGALCASVEFTANPALSFPENPLRVPGTAYEIGPPGTTFEHLVTLTLTYDPNDLPAGVREEELRLQRVAGSEWQPTVGSSVDVSRHQVSGRIESVGQFGVVGVSAASVVLSPTLYTLGAGDTKQLLALVRGPAGEALSGRRLTWTSGNEDVATVDSTGVVTAVGSGSTIITASVDEQRSVANVYVYDCAAQTQVPAAECLAVIDLYDALTGGGWRDSDPWTGGIETCHWSGVHCQDGAVSWFILRSSGRTGSIPYSITDLVHLTQLDLSGNILTGGIPSFIGSLASLEYLSLAGDHLTGTIPPELGQLTNLKRLYLNINDLSGPIPSELGNLADLTDLSLSGNRLTGAIPPELGSLSGLVQLSLYDNQLSGSIPRQLGGLTNLQTLSFFLNDLTGSIPRELGNLTNLTSLQLSRNQLSGSIPTELGNLASLEYVGLDQNKLTGPVPLPVARLGGMVQSKVLRTACVFAPQGTTGLSMPDNQDFRDADLDGDGLICGVPIG